MESLEEKIARVVAEHVAVVPYDPRWPRRFEEERSHLLSCLPADLVRRIEHFGSTAVPGLAAKPIVDILVEVSDLEETRRRIAPLLEAQGYEYFWRPSSGDDTPPFYAWFIKRDETGSRTHHIHMVEAHFEHWDRLLFRDYLIEHPDVAREYGELKVRLSADHERDRVAYTEAKSEFVASVTARAREHFRGVSSAPSRPGVAAPRRPGEPGDCVGVVLVVARFEGAFPLLLLLRRSGGRFGGEWWPVTGTLKPAEKPVAGALRELAEETGLTPDAVYDTGLSAPETESGGTLQVLVATVPSDAQIALNWEHDAYQWCSLSEAQAIVPDVAHPFLAEAERVARVRPARARLFAR